MEAARAGGRFVVRDGLVCRVRGGDEVAIVIPDDSELRTELLTKHHDLPLAGHLGLYRMTKALSKRYYWKGMYRDCRAHIRRCHVCQGAKVST